MTKYILNSGGSNNNPDKAIIFSRELMKGLGSNPKILFCLFAQPREDWENKFLKHKENLLERIDGDIKPVVELAFPDKFVSQMVNNDAIIIYGGDDHLLQYWLKQYDLPKIWEGKVVAGSSAGSDALVKHFWTCDWRQCRDGLGILPLKFIPHYNSTYGSDDPRGPIDWQKAYDELSGYGDKSLPIHALEEGDFIVIEKE